MFSNITEAWNNDPVKEITNKLNNSTNETISLSDNTISISSNNSLKNDLFPIDKDYKILSKNNPIEYDTDKSIDLTDSIINQKKFDTNYTHNYKHLKKCDNCYNYIMNLIDTQINKRMNDIILNEKLKQLKLYENNSKNNIISHSWKDTLIIVSGIIIVIIVILLIFKTIKK